MKLGDLNLSQQSQCKSQRRLIKQVNLIQPVNLDSKVSIPDLENKF